MVLEGFVGPSVGHVSRRQSGARLNEPVDFVADGAGEVAPRRPKSFFNPFFSDPMMSLTRIASGMIFVGKERGYRNSTDIVKSTAAALRAVAPKRG